MILAVGGRGAEGAQLRDWGFGSVSHGFHLHLAGRSRRVASRTWFTQPPPSSSQMPLGCIVSASAVSAGLQFLGLKGECVSPRKSHVET